MQMMRAGLIAGLLLGLSGCKLTLLNPSGDIAAQQGDLIVYSTVLMLIVIVPVMALTVFFAIKYRSSNTDAEYDPEWDHSVSLEVVIWAVPMAIIICLAGLTWLATHRLEPYNDLQRISADKPIDPTVEPLRVQVVALDWKWLFIYPDHGIATVNEAAVVVDRPVEWSITSATVMNAFYVPEMAGMIYAMAGMNTELNAVVNAPGVFKGFSANYSGNGFSHMRFDLHAGTQEDFDTWVEQVRGSERTLDRDAYVKLEASSVDHPVTYYNGVEDRMWYRVLNMCVGEDDLCLEDLMMVDALGGGGIDGLYNRELYRGLCSAEDPESLFVMLRKDAQVDRADLIHTLTNKPSNSSHQQAD